MKKLVYTFLLLLYQLGFSQSITTVQYWFGDNFDGRRPASVATNANGELSFTIAYPDDNNHQLNDYFHCRFMDNRANWSPIYSQQMKGSGDISTSLVKIQYWFNNDYSTQKTEDTKTWTYDNKLSRQVHTIAWPKNATEMHYRFKGKYNNWTSIQAFDKESVVYTDNKIAKVEYWYGDNFDDKLPPKAVTANANNEISIDLPFPDNGINKLDETVHYRFIDGIGNYSPIFSERMVNSNVGANIPVKMEYWFDNDFAKKTTIPTLQVIAPKGLDHQEAEIDWKPNAQNIHYRFSSKFNQFTSIQSSNVDAIRNINNKIVLVEYWLNDNFNKREDASIIQFRDVLRDNRNLNLNTDIQQTVNVRYKDKMNRFSPVYSFYNDYQGEPTAPNPTGTINLVTTKLPGGNVKLDWNSVENGKLYQIFRDGLYWRSLENSSHPQNLEATDFPPLGNHKYQVVAKNFLNANVITSNFDDETIEQADIDAQNDPTNTNLYGTLNLKITDEKGNRIDKVFLTFSHDSYFVFSNLGQFKRDGLPYKTKGTITLAKTGFTFKPVTTAEYDISEPIQNLAFIATATNSDDPIADAQEYSLAQSTNLKIETEDPQYKKLFEASTIITNISKEIWSGKLQLVAYNTVNSNSSAIPIAEVQESNINSGSTRLLEFEINELNLEPGNYKLKVLAYKNFGDVNSTIEDLKLDTGVENNSVEVSNTSNIISRELAKLGVENAFEIAKFVTKLFENPDKGKYNPLLKEITKELDVVGDYFEKSLLLIDAIQAVDAIFVAGQSNDFKDYFAALIKINELNPTPLKAVLGAYLEAVPKAITAIEKIKNTDFETTASLKFNQGHIIKLKIIKSSSFFGKVDKYYKRTDFINKIASIDYIQLNYGGFEQSPKKMDIIDCGSNTDDKILCISAPAEGYDIVSHKAFIRIIWSNSKITYIPLNERYFKSPFFDFSGDVSGDYYCTLNAKGAGGNADSIETYVYPDFK